ncbi:MAG: trimethylamine methyltransferase family protein [Pseudomonadota bacterium]
MSDTRTATRRGRSARRQRPLEQSFDEAWRRWKNPYTPIEQFSHDEIEAIHDASLKVLRDIGIKVLHEEARSLYRSAGMTEMDDGVIRFDTDALMELIAQAPSEITLHSWNPARNVVIGGRNIGITTSAGSPNCSDIERGRRPGTQADFEAFCKVAQAFDVIHFIGPVVEPQDLDLGLRHMHMTRAVATLTEKIPFVYFRGREAIADSYEILRIAHGLSNDDFAKTPVSYSVANSNSPLQLDALMCRGIIDAATFGQMMILTPFTLAGAMAPVTIPGALVMQNAEALAGLCLSQIVRKGAPVCYGSFTSNVDMRTGAPAFGTPEYVKAAFASGQLARRYGLPLRSSAPTASNAPDAQAAYESQMSLWGALMGGANLILHGAGWLEGGLTISAEKFIIDIEVLQMFAELFKPVEVSEDTLGLEAIADVGHGGHFFGTAHTLARFETAFYSPLLSDWSNYENYRDRGAIDTTKRAHDVFNDRLASHQPPPLDPARLEELNDFIARRTSEGGADIDR